MPAVDLYLSRRQFVVGATVVLARALGGAHLHAVASAGLTRLTRLPHPEPRPGVTAAQVLPVERLAKEEAEVQRAYASARAYPALFDGLYCACRCRDTMKHRSLLACFEGTQPMGCAGCREEAALVGRLAEGGKTLAQIRAAVDEQYSS
jgi:hypothetical protein